MTLQKAKSEVRLAISLIKLNRRMGISSNGIKFGGANAKSAVKRMDKGFEIVRSRGGFAGKGCLSEFNKSARNLYLEYIKAVRSPASKRPCWY